MLSQWLLGGLKDFGQMGVGQVDVKWQIRCDETETHQHVLADGCCRPCGRLEWQHCPAAAEDRGSNLPGPRLQCCGDLHRGRKQGAAILGHRLLPVPQSL